MRQFLLSFSVFLGVLLLLALLPGTQRLFAEREPASLPEAPRAAQSMPAVLVAWVAAEPQDWTEVRQQPGPRPAATLPQPDEARADGRQTANARDANGNALSRRTYRRSVYQAFILGDTMG